MKNVRKKGGEVERHMMADLARYCRANGDTNNFVKVLISMTLGTKGVKL